MPEIVRMWSIVALLGFHRASHWSAIMEIFRRINDSSHKRGPGCWSDLGARCCKPACWILEIILIMSKVISESSVLICRRLERMRRLLQSTITVQILYFNNSPCWPLREASETPVPTSLDTSETLKLRESRRPRLFN